VRHLRYYLWLLLAFGAGIACTLLWPEPALAVLTVAVPVSIAGAIVAAVYLGRVFRQQPEPRSRFFRLFLETVALLVTSGAWVGYLTVARLTERAVAAGTLSWALPAPPPTYSSPISALVVIAVFASLVRFALEVYQARRRASATPEELDREGRPEEL
jgi:hypothetical protein